LTEFVKSSPPAQESANSEIRHEFNLVDELEEGDNLDSVLERMNCFGNQYSFSFKRVKYIKMILEILSASIMIAIKEQLRQNSLQIHLQ